MLPNSRQVRHGASAGQQAGSDLRLQRTTLSCMDRRPVEYECDQGGEGAGRRVRVDRSHPDGCRGILPASFLHEARSMNPNKHLPFSEQTHDHHGRVFSWPWAQRQSRPWFSRRVMSPGRSSSSTWRIPTRPPTRRCRAQAPEATSARRSSFAELRHGDRCRHASEAGGRPENAGGVQDRDAG